MYICEIESKKQESETPKILFTCITREGAWGHWRLLKIV